MLSLLESDRNYEKLIKLNTHLFRVQENRLKWNGSELQLPLDHYVFGHSDNLYVKIESKLYEIDYDNKIFTPIIEENADSYKIIRKNLILANCREDKIKYLKLYQDNKLKWKKNHPGIYRFANPNYFISLPSFKSTIVEIYSLSDLHKTHSLKVSDDYEIYKTIYVVDNILIIPHTKFVGKLKTDQEVKLTGFNIESGEKLWEIDSPQPGKTEWKVNESDSQLYNLAEFREGQQLHLQLTILNPANGKYETYTMKQDHGGLVLPWNTQIEGDKIYYSDNLKGCRVGIVDLSKKELLDEIELNLDEGVKLFEPYFFEDNIYVLDTLKTMHTIQVN